MADTASTACVRHSAVHEVELSLRAENLREIRQFTLEFVHGRRCCIGIECPSENAYEDYDSR